MSQVPLYKDLPSLSVSAQPLIFYSSAEPLLTTEIEKGKKKIKREMKYRIPRVINLRYPLRAN